MKEQPESEQWLEIIASIFLVIAILLILTK